MTDLEAIPAFLARRYAKPIIVVETGQDWRGTAEAGSDLPSTPEGQRDFLRSVIQIVKSAPDGLGAGVFYWAPEWIARGQWRGTD